MIKKHFYYTRALVCFVIAAEVFASKLVLLFDWVTAHAMPGTLMGVMALKTPQATTADEKSGGRWLPKTVFCM